MTDRTTGETTSHLAKPSDNDRRVIGSSPAESANLARPRLVRMQGRFYTQLLPLLVFAVSMAVTYQLWQGARQNAQQALQTQFDFHVRDIADNITKRLKTYEQVMRGVDGLFAHSSIVERSEFHDYIARLNLKENYPGIQAIRYSPFVSLADKDKHTAAARKEGLAGYNIQPEGRRDSYAPVVYAEPYDERNKVVFGYDMLSDKDYPRPGDAGVGLRRAAMEQARDSGQASITGKLRLLFEKEQDEQAGFLMILPVYRHDAPHQKLAERRANIIGWVSSVFRMGDLMNGILGGHEDEVDIDIYDGETVSGDSLMYDPHNRQASTMPESRFQNTRHLEVAGHKWTVVMLSMPAFEAMLDREKPKTVAFIGTASSLLLALLTWLLVYGRERALRAAAAVERAGRKNEMLLRTASDGIYIFDLHGNVQQVNDAFCRMLGYTQHEMLDMNVMQWNAQWTKEELLAKINALKASNPIFETVHRRRDGSLINVEVSATRVEIDGQEVIYNSARDITERTRTEAAFRTIAGTAAANVGTSFFQETTRSLCALLEADCVIVGKQVDGNRIQALGMQLDGKAVEHFEYALSSTPCETATSSGYCEFPENVCQLFPSDIDLVNMGAEAYVGSPTWDKKGNVNGILCAIFRHKLAPQAMRKEVFEIIADRAGAEIEREQAEEAIRESEEHFRTIFDDSPIAIWEENFSAIKSRFDQLRKEGVTDFRAYFERNPGAVSDLSAQVQVLRINQTSAHVVGAESKEQVFRDLPRYFTAESLEVFKEELIALAEGQMRFRSEIPLINSKGEAVIFDLSLVVEPSRKDTLSQVLVSFQDITERKRVEMQREQFFRFFTLSIDLQCIAGQDGFFKRVNPAFIQLLGFSEKELLERPYLEFILPDDRQSTLDEVAKQLQGGITLDYANRFVCKDGSIRWLSWKAFLNKEDGLLYATARDITERRKIDEALRESEERWSFALEGAGDGVWDWDLQNGKIVFSKRYKEILGFSGEADWNSIDDWKDRVNPEDMSRAMVALEAYLDGKQPAYTVEYRMLCRDGKWKWMLARGMVVARAEDGRPMRMIGTHTDITERKQVAEALSASEERFRSIFDYSKVGISLAGPDYKYVKINRAFCELTGYSEKELLSHDFKDITHPDDVEPNLTLSRKLLAGEIDSFQLEKRYIRKDGGITWVALSVSTVRDEDRALSLIIGIVQDITERKQAAEALHESENQLRLLLDSAAEAIYGIDMHGNCTFCNPSCIRLLGYRNAEELIGKNMHQLVHHKHADGTPFPVEECQIYMAFQRGANTHVDDQVFWRADGSSFPVEYWSHPQFHEGVAVGAVVTFLDITERMQANEKLLKLSRAVENSPASVVITDMNGTIEYVNRRFTQVTGYLPKEVVGQNPRVLNAGIQTKEFYKEMWATILSGKEWQGEIYNRKKNGEIYLEYAYLSPIRDDNDIVTHFVAVKEDITKRKQTELELQKAMAAAEAASRAKGDFLANMSHEIRTPMNAIIGLSHLCMQTELTPKQNDYLHKVHSSAKALLGIINDVLDFSKIEAGKIEMEQVRFELEDVMGNLATVVSTRAEEKGLEFLFETSLNVYPHLIGDPLRLGQVLINLAGNAVKFTEKGEVLVLTEVEEETADDVVLRFTIQDSGIGMTQEQIGKLFNAFTQADSTTTRKFGGTGLGLSISKQLVSLMNGKIWVESTPGVRSKFIFTARFGKAVERRTGKRHIPNVDLQGIRVLAVDDNATCRHILQSYLGSFTLNVTMASNGLQALQAVERADREGMPYQFVVLDWKMPEMDGIEAARKIKGMAGLSKMPKIMLISSYNQSEMLKHVENDSAVDGILAKPFLQSELFNATIEIFGRAEARGKRNTETALFHPDLAAKISGAYLLLVEDNEINQQVARELLEKAGVTVAIAENGKEAVARLWEERFDGVLMDMQMPVMDGITATREIRKNPRLADLPIIAMTANVMVGDREQCLAAGMNDHITKPLDPNQMLSTLARWVVPAEPAAHEPNAAPSQEALPDLPGVRVAEGVRRMGGSVAGYCAILEKFRNGQQNTLAGIRSAIEAGDWEKGERLMHTLKGLLGTLGADKLMDKAAELENAIRGRANVHEALLAAMDAELTPLFAVIDRVLQAQVMEKGADAEVADTGPINKEELSSLIHQAAAQLEQFDSGVEDTVARIRRMVSGDAAMKKMLVSIERHVSSYNYEQALSELTACAKSMGTLREG